VVSVGSFMGMGEKLVVLPLREYSSRRRQQDVIRAHKDSHVRHCPSSNTTWLVTETASSRAVRFLEDLTIPRDQYIAIVKGHGVQSHCERAEELRLKDVGRHRVKDKKACLQ